MVGRDDQASYITFLRVNFSPKTGRRVPLVSAGTVPFYYKPYSSRNSCTSGMLYVCVEIAWPSKCIYGPNTVVTRFKTGSKVVTLADLVSGLGTRLLFNIVQLHITIGMVAIVIVHQSTIL